jgi:WD40 repeat protein
VAAGTAFGEIMYWSWNRNPGVGSSSRIHRVFLGHEGSIFGVHISKELPSGCCQTLKRIVTSCSDDRTIRVWDVSDVVTQTDLTTDSSQGKESERTHHTGFSNADFDLKSSSSSQCIAIGWGHASRVWTVQFLESTPCEGALFLLSAGEDATSRTWKLSLNTGREDALPYKLIQQDCAAHHSGKNIWSSSIYGKSIRQQRVACGAADAKITSHPLSRTSEGTRERVIHEYTVLDVLSRARLSSGESGAEDLQHTHKSSKKAEFLRSYCFLDHNLFLLTTNSGKVLLGQLNSHSASSHTNGLAEMVFVDQRDDLSGYSVCTGDIESGVAFIAGTAGAIYMFSKASRVLVKIGSADGKIGEMFTTHVVLPDGRDVVLLLTTLVGHKEALLLYVDIVVDSEPCILRTVTVSVSELPTGSTITSMALAATSETSFLYLGFRRGSVAVYSISNVQPMSSEATLFREMERVHGGETVTALKWVPSSAEGFVGHLTSVGRDGYITVQHIDLLTKTVESVHNMTLPIGPNIEGLYFHEGHVIVHGFSSKKWVLYDTTTEEEIMSVETGGAHRSWAFQHGSDPSGGGTLVWTRASSMHVCSQTGLDHNVVRPGGHGREVKAVAVAHGSSHHLVATGAEDTDIKIFGYIEGELLCRRTLRRHTTGIQHLQWSENGEYLFSSGGCEEFYVWRIRQLPFAMSIGIVCEFSYAPESEHADLRIMSFDVTQQDDGYIIAMVFSDSSIKVSGSCCWLSTHTNIPKVYRYSPKATVKWQPLAKGLYFTSCLTQCMFLSPESILTAGTDGHAVVWPLATQLTLRSVELASSPLLLKWQEPVRIHQSSSKVMASHCLDEHTKLVISGGDDGSLAVLLTRRRRSTTSPDTVFATAPVLLSRTHASAITACAVMTQKERIFVVTSGNDQWIRLWEVCISEHETGTDSTTARFEGGVVDVRRVTKVKTNVADVSSMAMMEARNEDAGAKVLLCGVGMEVVRLEWNS